MFTVYDQFAEARDAMGKAVIERDRKKFDAIYKIIEQQLLKNVVIMGGDVTVRALESKVRGPDDYVYMGYHERPLVVCNTITNLIYTHLKDQPPEERIVSMSTDVPYHKYSVEVQGRKIVTMIQLKKGMRETIKPPVIKYFSSGEFRIVSPEVLLMMTYRGLSNPAEAGEWDHMLEMAEKLETWVSNRRKVIVGGSKKRKTPPIATALKKHVAALGMIYLSCDGTLEAISDSAEESIKALEKEVRKMGQHKTQTKYSHMNLIGNPRMLRWSLRVDGHEVAYVYNLAEYQLVPYMYDAGSKMNVAGKYVQLMFVLVNIYRFRQLGSAGILDKQFVASKLNIYLDLLLAGLTGPSVWELAPHYKYLGKHITETLARKLDLVKSKKRFGRYHPEIYMAKNGQLRQIQ